MSDGKEKKNTTRPIGFNDYVGQDQSKKILQILCKSAKMKGSAIPHLLMSGRAGLGKTTLARITANEMNSNLIELVASNISDPQQLSSQLAQIEKGDILFIDEIHSLNRTVEEVLYSAIEDYKISIVCESEYNDLMKNLGMASSKQSRTVTMDLPDFTLVGATTLSGLVSAPLRSRFVQTLVLEPYSNCELEQIVVNASQKMGFKVSKTVAREIAKRSRNTARIAIGHLTWIVEYCNGTGAKANLQSCKDAFDLKGIDENGLARTDLNYLSVLVDRKKPVGLSSLSACLGESERTLQDTVEPYLMQKGLIRRDSRGRVAEQKAFELMEERKAVVA